MFLILQLQLFILMNLTRVRKNYIYKKYYGQDMNQSLLPGNVNITTLISFVYSYYTTIYRYKYMYKIITIAVLAVVSLATIGVKLRNKSH